MDDLFEIIDRIPMCTIDDLQLSNEECDRLFISPPCAHFPEVARQAEEKLISEREKANFEGLKRAEEIRTLREGTKIIRAIDGSEIHWPVSIK